MFEYSDECEKSSFIELLNMQDFDPNSVFDLLEQPTSMSMNNSHLNAPTTPNYSSISSESTENPPPSVNKQDDDDEEEENNKKTKKELKVKKTNDKKKKQREARFAFMTKSEVDHLEDGYRWRKYGQKAVKNSPFPRSYYRCTNASCNVKKRVERSCSDATIVVTTYEGQHTHSSPQMLRPTAAAVLPPPQHHHHHHLINYSALFNGGGAHHMSFGSPASQLQQPNNGLLQDMLLPWSTETTKPLN